MTHTPGPWRANGVQIDGPDGMLAECGFGMRRDEETLANAHLIAAAPNLLATLEVIANSRDGEESMHRNLARVALAAARGEVPA